MMRVLIVDDEAPARARLRRMLNKISGVEIVGEATNGLEALEQIETLKPDVAFLDIEMPELDGLGVAQTIKESATAFVFVTAYSEHALKAFEVAATDYLVKPVAEERLKMAVDKLRQRRLPAAVADFSGLSKTISKTLPTRRFAVRCGAKYVVFNPAAISAIIARDHYAAIVIEGRELLADDSLETLVSRLDSAVFIRVHRSAVINVDFLKELEREGDRRYMAVLSDAGKTKVPVSRERLQDLKAILGLR